MSFSKAAREVIKKQLDNGASGQNAANSVTYAIKTGLKDPSRDGSVASVSFKFSKPVSEDLLESKSDLILSYMSANLDISGDLGIVEALFNQILPKNGSAKSKRMKKETSTGIISVKFGDPQDSDGTLPNAVTGANGRFVSLLNLRSLLELLAKEYLIQEMRRGGAPLKYRTGRFANSLKVKNISYSDTQGTLPQLNINYGYMTRPYSVFNPAVSTYRKLSLRPYAGARNPQRLIGEALTKAARKLIHSRYNISISQGT
jgi:hypothetical protein